ncbi:MAG TPA: glucosamine-6-phosphate deaminase [Oligoflexia bacterium]|nr:glucosamine-6-phosphate deaminase [Oligoflexia bacterium]HMR23800.1 glucosamine-6-phosphate deaminase [Oligoflexia bacterium]
MILQNIKFYDTPEQAASTAAQDVFLWLAEQKKSINIVLATGRTPVIFYRNLIKNLETKPALIKECFFLNLDEYVGYEPSNPYSFAYFLKQHVIKPLGLTPEQYSFWDGASSKMQDQIIAKEQMIQDRGGLDLVILGLGTNAHIAFNEPGTPFNSQCHLVNLSQQTLKANQELLDPDIEKPKQAVTMGISTILAAKKIIVLAFGKEKIKAVQHTLMNKPSENWPASALQSHDNCHFYFDEAIKNGLIC